MILGFIGLGRMGGNMVLNLLDHKQKVVVYNRTPEKIKSFIKKGAILSYSYSELVSKLPDKKIIWLMVSSSAVDSVIKELIPYLSKGDILIDGGNSYFKDSIRRYNELKKLSINFLDIGVSGGVEGARNGTCLMVGGDKNIFLKVKPIIKELAIQNGYAYVGSNGAGHFVKMVHNGIEYGMIQSIAEGFNAHKKFEKEFNLNLKDIAKVYSNGSIVSSSLVNWLVFAYDKNLIDNIQGVVPHGETEDEMKKLEKLSYMPVLHYSILERVKSRKKSNYSSKVVAALRNEFGGHEVKK